MLVLTWMLFMFSESPFINLSRKENFGQANSFREINLISLLFLNFGTFRIYFLSYDKLENKIRLFFYLPYGIGICKISHKINYHSTNLTEISKKSNSMDVRKNIPRKEVGTATTSNEKKGKNVHQPINSKMIPDLIKKIETKTPDSIRLPKHIK